MEELIEMRDVEDVSKKKMKIRSDYLNYLFKSRYDANSDKNNSGKTRL